MDKETREDLSQGSKCTAKNSKPVCSEYKSEKQPQKFSVLAVTLCTVVKVKFLEKSAPSTFKQMCILQNRGGRTQLV